MEIFSGKQRRHLVNEGSNWVELNYLNPTFLLLLDDSCKTASDELANIDGVPGGQVIEVVVPA